MMNRYINIAGVIICLGAAIAGLVLSLALSGDPGRSLGWIGICQACVVLVAWPHMHRELHVSISPAVIIFLCLPVYAVGVRLSGAGVDEVAGSILMIYMLFLYVAFMLRLERLMEIPPAAWYLPLSFLLVVGPIVVYYVLAEFLGRSVPWVAGISPMVALFGGTYLRTGCGAWACVLAVVGTAGMLAKRKISGSGDDRWK